MTQNNERVDITQLEQINAVQSIRNAETLDDALRVMNGLAANGWLRLWDNATHPDGTSYRDKPPISQNEQQEAVAERDKLGYAVVEVIGKLDEIIEVAEDIEFNDFAHIAIPLELWNELKDALELMPERADNYTSPPKQAIPEGWRPIETAPHDEAILVAGGDCHYPCVGNWSGHHEDVWRVDGQMDTYSEIGWPTHWMPLPTPTSKEKG